MQVILGKPAQRDIPGKEEDCHSPLPDNYCQVCKRTIRDEGSLPLTDIRTSPTSLHLCLWQASSEVQDSQGITAQKTYLHKVALCIPNLTNLPPLSSLSPPPVPSGALDLSPEKLPGYSTSDLCGTSPCLMKNWLSSEDSTFFMFLKADPQSPEVGKVSSFLLIATCRWLLPLPSSKTLFL